MSAVQDTLLIDAGNTRIKFGIVGHASKTFKNIGAIDTQASSETMAAYLLKQGLMGTHALGVCVAGDTVKSRLNAAFTALAFSALGKSDAGIHWLSGNTALHGLRSDYATPLTLGADRWLAAYGLIDWLQSPKQPCILATFGTATTIDLVYWDVAQQSHVFAGGIIIAGLATAWRSVSHSTAQLPDVSALNASADGGAMAAVPNSTHGALQLGALYAQAGAVQHFASIAAQRYGAAETVLAGGAAALMQPYLKAARILDLPVLHGLARVVFQDIK
jgi:type III pantothenate kinase